MKGVCWKNDKMQQRPAWDQDSCFQVATEQSNAESCSAQHKMFQYYLQEFCKFGLMVNSHLKINISCNCKQWLLTLFDWQWGCSYPLARRKKEIFIIIFVTLAPRVLLTQRMGEAAVSKENSANIAGYLQHRLWGFPLHPSFYFERNSRAWKSR